MGADAARCRGERTRRSGWGRRRDVFAVLVPLLVAAPLILAGCTGSLARAVVEPDAGAFGFGSATFFPEDQLVELRSAMTGKLGADTVKAAGAGGAVIHAFVLEPGPYGLAWTSRREDDDGFRFSFGFESDSAALPRRGEPRGTLVALHGLGGEGVQLMTQALFFAEHGYRVVLPDLRAHGQSGGRFVTYGHRERTDVREVVAALRARGRLARPLVLYGTSLGGAVALRAAGGVDADRVVAVAPVADAREVVAEVAPEMLPDPLALLVSEERIEQGLDRAERLADFSFAEVSPLSAARDLSVPVLLIHSRDDDLVPFDHARRLHGALPCSTLRPVEGRGHAALLMDRSATAEGVLSWLEETPACPTEDRASRPLFATPFSQ